MRPRLGFCILSGALVLISPALLLIGGAAGMAERGREGSAWPFVGGIVLAYLAAVGAVLALRAGISLPGDPAPRAWPLFVLLMPLAAPVTLLALSVIPVLGAVMAAVTAFVVYRMIRSLRGGARLRRSGATATR